jgi:hypothetical protein
MDWEGNASNGGCQVPKSADNRDSRKSAESGQVSWKSELLAICSGTQSLIVLFDVSVSCARCRSCCSGALEGALSPKS